MVAWGTIAAATIKGASKALTKGGNTAKNAATKTAEQAIENTAQNIGANVASDAIGAVAVIVLGGVVITSQVGIGALHAGNTVRGWLKNPLSLLMSDTTQVWNGASHAFAPLTIHTPFLIDETPPGSYDFTLADSNGLTSVNVPSPCQGEIIDAGTWGGYGNGLDLQCSDGMVVRMTHFARLGVTTGVSVQLGQPLGIQGTTGNSTGDHVHLEITIPGHKSRTTDRTLTRPIVEKFFEFWQDGQSGSSIGDDFYSRYKTAIAQQESSGNPTLVNQDSGALGLYQFMPETLAGLATSCVGYQPSHSEFLGNVALQDQVMDCYLDSAKPRITATDEMTKCRQHASHHYSGDPNKYANTARQTYGGNSYPSIADYTISVCSKL